MSKELKKFKFKTYSWSFGTTSFRDSQIKYKIERQLIILKEMFDKYKSKDKLWNDLQELYRLKLNEENLFSLKSITDIGKDARVKTSSLVDLGLIDKDRKTTNVGNKIYEILINKKYSNDNVFFIRNDSFIYLLQFLKLQLNPRNYSEFKIRPFIAVIKSIIELGYLKETEFIYMLPLCKTYNELDDTIEYIKNNRENLNPIDFIKKKLVKTKPFSDILDFINNENQITEKLFEKTYIDRKSSTYYKKYYNIYKEIIEYSETDNFEIKKEKLFSLIKTIQKNLDSKIKSCFINEMFCLNDEKIPQKIEKVSDNLIKNFENNFINEFKSKKEIFKNFFIFYNSVKWKINLEEYYDLNKRFIKLTDIFIFEDESIKLDIIPKVYFEKIIDDLTIYEEDINKYLKLYYNYFDLDKLHKTKIDFSDIIKQLKEDYKIDDSAKDLAEELRLFQYNQRKEKFDELISKKFDINTIVKILQYITKREDKEIYNIIDCDADVPTIFEYIIGISWYIISEKKGDLSDFFNLHLDANFLPKSFAAGGMSDMVFKYDNHHLLLEVTLTIADNQRKMELEPVSRHLGKYRLFENDKTYALFIAPFLDPNVLVVFRAYKSLRFYNNTNKKADKHIEGLKIIPLTIDLIILFLQKKIKYTSLKFIFDEVYNHSQQDGTIWFSEVLEKKLNEFCNKKSN